jgi:hypothetical protein
MDPITSLAIISFAALIHTSFQLSVSMLTLMSGHAIGRQTSHRRLLGMTGSFLIGVGVMTLLLLSSLSFIVKLALPIELPIIIWAMLCGGLIGLGVAVWVFYYRRSKGTSLWIPRFIATFLSSRAKVTQSNAESFSLGITSVIVEIIFIIGPLTVAALTIINMTPLWAIAGLTVYTAVSLISLTITWFLIGSGTKLSTIQRWREENKNFLQFIGGSGLIVLGLYLYVNYVISPTIGVGM